MHRNNKLVLAASLYPHRALFPSMKRMDGVEYVCVESASEALLQLEHNPEKYDLVILGMDMHPGMDPRIHRHLAVRRLSFLSNVAVADNLWQLGITIHTHIQFSFASKVELMTHVDPVVIERIAQHGTLHFTGSPHYEHFDYVDAVLSDLGKQRKKHV
jgi:hypothetical protein